MVSSKRLVTVPGTAVVAPPPLVQALVRSVGDINIGATAVVAPAPRLPVGEQHPISGALQSTMGARSHGLCRLRLPLRVPKLRSGWARGIVVRRRIQCRAASAVGSECRQLGEVDTLARCVPQRSIHVCPAPGVQVVPPPPSLQGSGNSGAGQRSSSLSNGGVGNGFAGCAAGSFRWCGRGGERRQRRHGDARWQ